MPAVIGGCAELHHDSVTHVLIQVAMKHFHNGFYVSQEPVQFIKDYFCIVLIRICCKAGQISEHYADIPFFESQLPVRCQFGNHRIHGCIECSLHFFFHFFHEAGPLEFLIKLLSFVETFGESLLEGCHTGACDNEKTAPCAY